MPSRSRRLRSRDFWVSFCTETCVEAETDFHYSFARTWWRLWLGALLRPLGLSMWRGPQASWLWPNRTGCHGPRTCCTLDSCPTPFAEAARLSALGLRQQYILDGLLLGVGDCEWRSFHENPHNCSLPGGPSDPDMAEWEYTVRAGAAEALRAGISELYFDVWVRCTIAPHPSSQNLPLTRPALTHRTSPTARTRCSAWRTTPAPTTPT